MDNKIILTDYNEKTLLAYIKDNKLIDLSLYEEDDNLGNVYLARVTKVLANIDACFAQYKKGHNAFVKTKDYKQESIIPIQIKKEAYADKDALATDQIKLTSRYAVISKGAPHISISSKIGKDLADKLKKAFRPLACELGVAIILRTNAQDAEFEEIENDIRQIANKLFDIYENSDKRTLYTTLYCNEPGFISYIRDSYSLENCEIVTDLASVYDCIDYSIQSGDLKNSGLTADDVRIYKDDVVSLAALYGLSQKIKEATSRTVHLKSGADLVIDQTEALVSIDVNTHNCVKKGDKEDIYFETNIEAAKEIMRQIRLRNLSGMIIIDFINMKSDSQYDELMKILRNLAKEDPIKTQIVDITGLKLVEIVRLKRKKSLYEQMR